ncbi:MAG: hypothetical protein HYT22_01215 [Candidatus Niyogibacteria bacterium]|nr:hypothetical protein [Candidatus Niyogibacteria bacterium]
MNDPLYRLLGAYHERLFDYERGLDFPGEIHLFRHPGIPADVLFACVKTAFASSTGGTHCDELRPLNPHGWASFDEAMEKVAHKALAMRQKNLIHGLPYGGSKGVIVGRGPIAAGKNRLRVFLEIWPHAINFFNGKLYTGADVGVGEPEALLARGRTPWVFGLPKNFGGSGDPSENTAYGLVGVIDAYRDLFHLFHAGGKLTVAIKGVGKVGKEVLRLLHERGDRIFFADVLPDAIEKIQREFSGVTPCVPHAIHKLPRGVDVFVPCDKDVAVTSETVDEFACKAIIGAANDQCRDPALEERLHERGILHMTDFLVNGGGVITITSELGSSGYDEAAVKAKIDESVIEQSRAVMQESLETGLAPYKICARLVQEEAERTGNVLS